MAIIANPRKVFNFRIEIGGFDQFEAQNVTFPKLEIAKTLHGQGNHKIKTAGLVDLGDIVMEALKPMPQTDIVFWTWIQRVQNLKTGGGQLPDAYKEIIIIKEMDSTGFVTLNSWICTGVWPCSYDQSKWDRMSSDNLMKIIGFSVDEIDPL